jgi:SAM-dependent methyltransferase
MRPEEYATMFRVEENHWWYLALHQLTLQSLEAELSDWREKTILDVGCGTGAILEQLGSPERNVGIDLAPEAVSFCQKRGLSNVRQGDICALPFADGSFDVVICSSVLYHEWVLDVAGALREMHRVLRPDGVLLINVPAFNFLHSQHDEAVMTARRFRKPEIRALLQKSNFRILRLSYWTSLLFPVAVAARTFGGSQIGRDFGTAHNPFTEWTLKQIMRLELHLLRCVPFPVGVALFAVARKQRTAAGRDRSVQ